MLHRQLTNDELEEITEFARVEGRKWKEILQRESWWRGLPTKDKNCKEYHTLYALRNTHGPSWLDKFRLPKN